MTEVRRCGRHGYFDAATCPDCGSTGRAILDGSRRRRLSKFASGALRHFPGDVGLDPDEAGWVDREELVAAVLGKYDWAAREDVDAVIATDPKGRFERDGGRVRAAYGHSIDVELGGGEGDVPDRLYHGTDPANVGSIREEGVKPMGRQAVHLSDTETAARAVGRRHADDPVVLAVDAARMRADGHRIEKRGTATYTVERVPAEYVEFP